jgi:tetrapyrrole methylase family protein/MazG family protein
MADSPGTLFEALLDIMQRLRGPAGCPWDREQTPTSLKPVLIEEAYEVLEALDSGSAVAVREELGDVLFQVVFHAQLARERGEFSMSDLLTALVDKMVRRHPHVFGGRTVTSAREALHQWEAIKQSEATRDGRPHSVLDGVPRSLPSLLRAQRLQAKAARVGFDWSTASEAWAKVREEIAEVGEAVARGDRDRVADELGDALFSLVNVARLSDIDAEEALQGAIEKFRRRFHHMEATLSARGTAPGAVRGEELERLWEAAKAAESRPADAQP